MTKLYGSLEAGGTKFVCAVGNEQFEVIEKVQFPTTTPIETLDKTIEFFSRFDNLASLAVGSFGPIDIDQNSKTYGYITTTPKPHWANVDIVGALRRALNVPIYFTTDVNSSAYGEVVARNNAGGRIENLVYYTIGTGIGAGAVVNGTMLQGLTHPEMGHIFMKRHPEDTYEGNCPFHKDCLEGMAAGPAIEKRWGKKGHELADNEKVWDLEAYYLAQALMKYVLILSPQRIIMGGGVMKQQHLFPRIRKYLQEFLNGYVQKKEILEEIDEYVVYPGLGDEAGFVGSIALGKLALDAK